MTDRLEAVQGWLSEIEEAESEVAYLNGVISAKKEELKSNFGVTTIKQAKTLLEKMEKETQALDAEIDALVEGLSEKFAEA